ncbi:MULTISPECIES: PQQ-dependent dehydrogenase, methanol/ethanol family [Deinococcus]|uniref:PQQ-dependent dehydrogenase, methanol/ethanol family n=1 Tax=Deinococcus rufus TaxID=2136097 RepID=A0ABV7ZF02_9DEIO|nr:PQQ-dependent dehydrogenase, methanol/ethanol family [Deinococcus sp. AB2017081]WQE94134.1 PQQ-dependent dehydrogenase, methanol/ethanol family [Deinococcus sp. AB2017081]
MKGSQKVGMMARLGALLATGVVLGGAASAQMSAYTAVTDARLAAPEASNWLSTRGNQMNWGYSALDKITPANVSKLQPAWAYSTGQSEGHEAAPIVNNGIMFITSPMNKLFALDATTGVMLWKYERELPDDITSCCDVVNRGVAVYGDMVYMGTLDAHMLAFNAKTGKIVWDRTIEDYKKRYTITSAPLIASGRLVTGVHGGEYGVRGFLESMDPKTGKSQWKSYTTMKGSYPDGSEAQGGAPTWLTGAYDAASKTIYWGTGNPSPWMDPRRKPTDDLKWSSSLIAVDVATGKIKTGFQYSPNDAWDYDGVNEPILIDTMVNGKSTKSIVSAHRNGYLYRFDRTNGGVKYVGANKYVTVTAYKGLDKTGRPIWDPQHRPDLGKQVNACPSFLGGKNWHPAAYSPQTKLVYIPSNEWCMTIKGAQTKYAAGEAYVGAEFELNAVPNLNYVGNLQAVDPATGKQVWSQTFKAPLWGGVLTTAGGLVFTGTTADRDFVAFDARSGKKLWSFKTNSGVIGQPISYSVNGKQYVAVFSGYGGAIPLWAGPMAQLTKDTPRGGVLWVFAFN